jgi:branched-chain amino acid transport system ATP-binding protein
VKTSPPTTSSLRSSTSEPLLRASGVSIAFSGIRALGGVSLEIPRGAIVAVIGPNGAGKTTLFNCITGVYRPDAGAIEFDGRSIVTMKPHQIAELGLGRTFQNIELFSRMTVLDNLLLGRHRHMRTGPLSAFWFGKRVRDEEVRERRRVEQILDFLDLQYARDRYVMHLAYGARKKVELARALALEPKLLLLDEPSAGMNAEEKEEMVHAVRDIRGEMGVTVVLVEHDMGLVMGISDRVVVLDHGEKIAEGSPDEITRDPEVIRAYLGGTGGQAGPDPAAKGADGAPD